MALLQRKKTEKQRQALLFGQGGKYTAAELNIRADMFDQLESTINLLKQDVKQLSMEWEALNR